MASHDVKSVTGLQLRAGRALLRWSAADLAAFSRLSEATVSRAEKGDGEVVGLTAANLVALRRALEDEGVMFIDADDNGGVGVRLNGER